MRRAPWMLIALAALPATTARADDAAVGLAGGAAADDVAACGLEDPAIAAAAPPVGERAADRRSAAPGVWGPLVRAARLEGARRERVGHGATGGALAGKTIYVSAGHGWIWDDALGRWRTQRGNTNGLVEDFISAETVAQHLIPMLRDMGAYVVPVRESSMQRQLVIVDDVDAGFTVDGATATAIADGWARPPEPIPDGRNPFAGGGSVELPVVAGGAAAARWVLDVPADGDYEVYVSWVQGADRAPDAPYVVHHAGGDSGFRVDQRRHGSTWVLLGQFHFAAGTSVEHGSIELGTDASAGAVVSADAVRLGGGMGHVDRGGGAVDRPAYESGARYAAQYNGAPSSVWDYSTVDGNDDVGTRSRFSAWDHEAGEDAVYVAWHTNAPSPARGTSSFAYGPSSYGPLSEFSGVDGSLELMDAIHTELVGDLRADWDPAWQDRGEHTAYFGEVNPSHNPEMPATLIEVAFHDTVEDADALRDPRFRALAARAFAEGVARYFATRDGVPLILPPEPPAAPRMIQGDGGGLTLAWDPPDDDPAGGDAATGYRVYLSADGRAFDDGHDVTGTSLAIDAGPGGAPVFARVTATNAGGESRPSPVVGARPAWGPTVVLVVGGFTRIDGAMLIEEDLAAYDLATVQRGYEDRINDGSHAARHGLALAGAGYAFDVASAEAVRRGEVTLDGYAAVSWLAGEELAPLGDADRAAVAAYLDGGGAFLISGTDVARALAAGAGDAPALLARLGVALVDDDAGTYAAAGLAGTAFDGLTLDFADDGPGGYDAAAADTLDAIAPAAPVMAYDSAAGAAVLARDDVAGRSLVLGFPIETVTGADVRIDLMGRALAALEVPPDPPVCDGPECTEVSSSGCCDAGGGGAGSALLAVLVLLPLTRRRRPARLAAPCRP